MLVTIGLEIVRNTIVTVLFVIFIINCYNYIITIPLLSTTPYVYKCIFYGTTLPIFWMLNELNLLVKFQRNFFEINSLIIYLYT